MIVPAPATPSTELPRTDLHHDRTTVMAWAARACEHAKQLRWQGKSALAENQILRQAIRQADHGWMLGPTLREPPHSPAGAPMVARPQTRPVIEQAKGIVMAQFGCGDAEAFDLLRRVSQRTNVPVRVLAAQIVAKAPA